VRARSVTKSVMGITATGRRRNHSWPEALKREIVVASFAPGSSVSMVARITTECEPGIQLAEALSRRPTCAGRWIGTAIDPCDSNGGDGCCRHGAVDCHGDDRD